MPKTKKENPTVSKEQEAHHRSMSIGGNVTDSVVVSGDGNQTTFQKIINIFKSDSESLDHRNRRVMLNHMENFWIKGVLEKSLHGVALLELGIKEDSTAVNYPWGIKKASTNETLPAGKSMYEIFKEIGLGRSLLILGAPGSGKTTMLLELTRQLIETARQDETEPIPVVFNLSSWTEKLTLIDWLAEQLNIFYYVPKKTAQKLVNDNKMFLLLDGLDEVKENIREKCVDAINQFKNEHGLTSLAICSRIEEYQAIQKKLSLAGAITLQPLTSEQVDTYFEKFGKSLYSLKQILKQDKTLLELTETPLMLSIMALAYKDVNIKEIPELKNSKEQRKHLFDTYINRMLERQTRSEKKKFSKEGTLHYLSWLAYQMIEHNLTTYQIEEMQPNWLKGEKHRQLYKQQFMLTFGLVFGLTGGLFGGLMFGYIGLLCGLIFGLFIGLSFGGDKSLKDEIQMTDKIRWSWQALGNSLRFIKSYLRGGLIIGLSFGLMLGGLVWQLTQQINWLIIGLIVGLIFVFIMGLNFGLVDWLNSGVIVEQIQETKYARQRLNETYYILIYSVLSMGFMFLFVMLPFCLLIGLIVGIYSDIRIGLVIGLGVGRISLFGGMFCGMIWRYNFEILDLVKHYALQNIITKNNYFPRHPILFLEYAVDLIFLRRAGGSYIFVHRLLMGHFAEMYVEKENK